MTKNEMVNSKKEQVGFTDLNEKYLEKMSKDSETYEDSVRAEDLAIPRINLLQSLSPQVVKSSEEYIKEAEAGDFFNTLNKEVYNGEKGFLFVLTARKISYIEWKDRSSGGGMINSFGSDSREFNKCEITNGKHISERGHEIVETHDVFGFVVNEEERTFSQVMMSFSKSKVKKMKIWNTLIRSLRDRKTGKQLPCYAAVYKLTSVPQSSDKGSWFNINIESYGYTYAIPEIGEQIYNQSEEFLKSINTNKVKVKHEQCNDFVDVQDEKI